MNFVFTLKCYYQQLLYQKNNLEVMFEKFKIKYDEKFNNNNEKIIIELFNKKFTE